ncbi:hypothetical protein [Actinokineospora sp. NBRC 105648]|uniref:DUF7402 domain-containing protein n=1 Tax=Actinokineospora sp. NBRC 105648 TaxID=3032206 RepID=UPI00249FFA17|nr:hypothetical protein [Actinokineospora sp. NBRC 105648]GLZ37053.1 hypothetical protein Acsp05_06780 [Actinokineospora sp. NBRC 105648]
MRLPARKHVPIALAALSLTTLAVLVPTATAAPKTGTHTAAAPTTFPPSSTPNSTTPTIPSSSTRTTQTTPTVPSCYTPIPTTTTTTTTTPGPTYTTSVPAPGTTYQPAPGALTSLPQPTTRPSTPGENIALFGYAQASSTTPGYWATKVNDGYTNAGQDCRDSWSTTTRSADAGPEWVAIRWHDYTSVGHIVLHTTPGNQLRDFDIQVLHQNGTWYDTVGTYNYNTANTVQVWFPPRLSRGVRVLAKVGPSSQPNVLRVNEVQVYAY